MLFVLLFLIMFVLLLFALEQLINLYAMDRKVANLPSPSAKPLIGHYHHLMANSIGEYYSKLSAMSFQFDRTFKFWIGPTLFINVMEKEHVRAAERCLDKPFFYNYFPPIFHRSTFIAKGWSCIHVAIDWTLFRASFVIFVFLFVVSSQCHFGGVYANI